MNKHITENILHYLALEKPEYSILLSGKWGSGKTYFIENFIKDYVDKQEKQEIESKLEKKFIKISLFGLKKVESIDEQIFQNLHPILGSKYAKITGGILKSAIKLGVDLDWSGDGKKDGTLNTDLKDLKLTDFFSEKGNKKKEIIFIFDDLERTQISLQEVLGYINYLIEQSSFKVILVANEEILIKNDHNNIYREFKEKVIGKTFEVQQYFSEILDSFLNADPIEISNFDKNIIIEIYERAGYRNLRHVKQSIIDFKQITRKINDEFLKNKEFILSFSYVFFMLNIEAKHGSLEEKDVASYNSSLNYFRNNKEEESTIEKISKKYNLNYGFLLTKKTLIKIIYKNYIEENELNKEIEKLSFFLERKEEARPSWVKLWYYQEVENSEFLELLSEVIKNFKNCSYTTPVVLLHVIALLIYFHKENISEFSTEEIKKYAKENVKYYSSSDCWKNDLITNDLMFNGTGLRYMNDSDPDFKEMFKFVKEKNEELYQAEQKKEHIDKLEVFLKEIKNENRDCMLGFLLNDNESSPVLTGLDSTKFLESLNLASNKFITRLFEIFSSRYTSRKFFDGQVSYHYLSDEYSFWVGLKEKLDDYNFIHLRGLILRQFKRNLVDVIVSEMAKVRANSN